METVNQSKKNTNICRQSIKHVSIKKKKSMSDLLLI